MRFSTRKGREEGREVLLGGGDGMTSRRLWYYLWVVSSLPQRVGRVG